MATNYLFQQTEVIAKNMPEFFGRFNVARNLIKKGKVQRIGERDFRSNFLTQHGGRFGAYNPDGGAIGRGTAAKGGTMIATFFSLRLNFELTELAKKATKDRKISQINALKTALKAALPEMANYCDMIYHTAGTAVIGTATAHDASSGKSVYTMDSATGVQLFRRGQYIIVYQNDLSAARDSGASRRIEQIDYENNKIYLDATVTSAAANDKFTFVGVTGASPTGVNGLYYFINSATSGYTLGVDRSTELELVSNNVNAGGVPTFAKGLQIQHKMLKRRGEVPKGLIGCVAPEQQANIRDQVQDIANFDLARGKLNADLEPGVDMKFKYAGMKCMLDIHQDTTRMDFIIPKNWIRAVLPDGDIQFYEDDNGDRFFNLYGSDGGPAAATWFGLVLHENFVDQNPGQEGLIYGCSQPTY